MFHFIKNRTSSDYFEDITAQVVELLVLAADGSLKLVRYEGDGALQDVTKSGTGCYANQKFQRGSQVKLEVSPEGGESGEVLLEVLWSRQQDQDNITSICIRQMIFGQYEADGQNIETDVLKLLHNPSRFASADLIQRFSIFDQRNLKTLEQLKNHYKESHPQYAYRHGTRVVAASLDSWIALIQPVLPKAKSAKEESSAAMQQFNRRQTHR